MLRRLFFAGVMLASGAVCAQDVAISGKDFLSGAGDAKIAELARQAAASGKTLVISAPPYWQDKAGAKAHAAAANASVRMSDAFFENVMLRIEDSKASARAAEAAAPRPAPTRAESRPEPKPVARAEPKAAPPAPRPVEPPPAPKPVVVEPPPVPRPAPVAAATAPRPESRPAPPQASPAAPPVPTPAPAAVARPPAPVAAAPAPKPAEPAPDPSVAIKQRMMQNLNGGQPADGTIEVAQMQKDDLLFVDGPVRAVVRRFGPRTQLFWLQGELNLERTELLPTGNDRYRVSEPIRNVANPSLRGTSKGGTLMFKASIPAPNSKGRRDIEARYNDGRDIDANLQPTDLRQGDLVYTDGASAVVVRRTSVGIERFWLVGEMDLHQGGLQTQGSAIRVLTDTVK
jgi:outer membrane biosynthesis protein TonB